MSCLGGRARLSRPTCQLEQLSWKENTIFGRSQVLEAICVSPLSTSHVKGRPGWKHTSKLIAALFAARQPDLDSGEDRAGAEKGRIGQGMRQASHPGRRKDQEVRFRAADLNPMQA